MVISAIILYLITCADALIEITAAFSGLKIILSVGQLPAGAGPLLSASDWFFYWAPHPCLVPQLFLVILHPWLLIRKIPQPVRG